MASKNSLKKYCRITQWIRAEHPPLAEAIQDLCMEGALATSRHSGVTFLCPPKGVIDEIVKKTYSANPDEAVDLLKAHIIRGPLSEAFAEGGTGTLLGLKVEGTSEGASRAELAFGKEKVTVEKAKGFDSFGRQNRNEIGVWTVVKGAVPTKGEAYERRKKGGGRRRREIRGGGDGEGPGPPGPAEGPRARAEIARKVEEDFCARALRGTLDSEGEPYLANVAALLKHLEARSPRAFHAALGVLDRDPAVSFYILLEPHKNPQVAKNPDYFLEDGLLFGEGAFGYVRAYPQAGEIYRSYFSGSAAAPHVGSPEVRSGAIQAIRDRVDQVRIEKVMGEDGQKVNKISVPNEVDRAYDALVKSNSIADLTPAIPEETRGLLKTGARKLWQDTVRFILHPTLAEVRRGAGHAREHIGSFIQGVRENHPGNNYQSEAVLVDQVRNTALGDAKDMMSVLVMFVNSTDFLYVPVCDPEINQDWNDIPTVAYGGDPGAESLRDSLHVLDSEQGKQRQLDKMQDPKAPAPSEAQLQLVLEAARDGKLTEAQLAQLRAALAPPEEG